MKVIDFHSPGGPHVLKLREGKDPKLKDDEVMIKVFATSINRKDLWIRSGCYPSEILSKHLGLECSGVISQVGKKVTGWRQGDKVCALLDGGGYAEKVAVSEKQIVSVPDSWALCLDLCGALPCAASIVAYSFFILSKLSKGHRILVHGAAGGVGALAIRVARYYGCQVFATAGTNERLDYCKLLGAHVCVNYKREDFSKRVNVETNFEGVNIILDCVGDEFIKKNVSCLARRGRLIFTGYKNNNNLVQMNLEDLANRDVTVMGLTLINTDSDNKAQLLREVEMNIWPAIEDGNFRNNYVKNIYRFRDAANAHKLMEKNRYLGKILLVPEDM